MVQLTCCHGTENPLVVVAMVVTDFSQVLGFIVIMSLVLLVCQNSTASSCIMMEDLCNAPSPLQLR